MNKPNLTEKEIAKLLKNAKKSFNMSDTEKGIMKAELNDVIKSGSHNSERSIIKNIINPRKLTMPLIPMIIAIVIAFGGGTAALANNAAPGDFLYPVDTFVEDFVEKFTRSDESRAVLHAQRVEERMQELEALEIKIQALADSGEIDAETLEKKRDWLAKHKEHLIEKLENRIGKTQVAQDKLQEKLEMFQVEGKRGQRGIERALGSLEEIGARQELMIAIWEEPGMELPIMSPELKAKLEAARKAYDEKMEALREKYREMWNGEIEIIHPDPINPGPEPMVFDTSDNVLVEDTDTVEIENEDDTDVIEDVLDGLLAL